MPTLGSDCSVSVKQCTVHAAREDAKGGLPFGELSGGILSQYLTLAQISRLGPDLWSLH